MKLTAVFGSTREAIVAERLARQRSIDCQVIPVPREISADCGIALVLAAPDRQALESLLASHNIKAVFHKRP
jgi:hypothetical protein